MLPPELDHAPSIPTTNENAEVKFIDQKSSLIDS